MFCACSDVLCLFFLGTEARSVVIVEKGQQIHRIGIHQILRIIVIEPVEAAGPVGSFFVEGFVHQPLQGEIHYRGKIAVTWGSQLAVFLPEGDEDIAVEPRFAHNVEMWVFRQHLFAPLGHEIEISIRMRVLTDAVDTGKFYPPDTRLDEVAGYMAVALIQVRHYFGEPSICGYLALILGGVDVLHTSGFVGGGNEMGLEVKPVVRRAVPEKVIFAATMIEYHIHHYFQPLFMRVVHQAFELIVCAEASVYLIVIRDGIAVVGAVGHVILLRRVKPDSRDSQIGYIVQMFLDAFQVASMTGVLLRAIHFIFQHPSYHIIVGITVGEAVGHDEVEHVLRGKSLDVIALMRTLPKCIGHGSGLFSLLQDDVKGLRCSLREVHI